MSGVESPILSSLPTYDEDGHVNAIIVFAYQVCSRSDAHLFGIGR
jgi:hypothetical protein